MKVFTLGIRNSKDNDTGHDQDHRKQQHICVKYQGHDHGIPSQKEQKDHT